jgi:methyl-accepting chemotaxis protein
LLEKVLKIILISHIIIPTTQICAQEIQMSFLKNLKIKSKLRIPIVLQLLLLLTFIYFYFNINRIVDHEHQTSSLFTQTDSKIRNLSNLVNDYTAKKIPFQEAYNGYTDVLKVIKENNIFHDKKKIAEFEALDGDLKALDGLFETNKKIVEEVNLLVDTSIKQSNQFLTDVSRKLVHRTQRRGVSDLERAVIAGATVNTTANFQIKVLLLETRDDASKGPELLAFIEQAMKNVNADEKRLVNTPFVQMVKKAKEANTKIKTLSTDFIKNLKTIEQTKALIFKKYDDAFNYFIAVESEILDGFFSTIDSSFQRLLIILVAFAILIIIFSLSLAKLIANPIKAMTERAYDLAVDDVDMTKRLHVDSKDEIGELAGWFNKFLERLQGLILKVKESSTELYHATEEISSTGEDLAIRTNEQASSIAETSTTVEEFTTSVRQNTEDSAEADMMLSEFNKEIQEKSSLIDNVTSTMNEISDSSKEIDNIIKVINDISFQTNLLALNAAVEAARAGEAGRGFAVVASEVRNLAQKTAESSKSIQEIVIRNVDSTQKGMELVNDTSSFFAEIVGVMSEIVNKISNITSVSRGQSTGIEQINLAINQMDQVSGENARLVEQLSTTGNNVKANAVTLQELVSYFKLDESQVMTSPMAQSSAPSSFAPERKSVEKTTGEDRKPKTTTPAVNSAAISESSSPTEEDFFGTSEEDGFEEF